MPLSWQKSLLWLLVLNLAIALGAGLYEHRIVFADWLVPEAGAGYRWLAEVAVQDDTGRRFWAFVTTGPLTLLTLASLVAAWRSKGAWRGWWLGASTAALADRLVTFGYFIPTMMRLMASPDSPQAVSTALQWASFNYGRHALLAIALLATLKAFAVFYQERGGAS